MGPCGAGRFTPGGAREEISHSLPRRLYFAHYQTVLKFYDTRDGKQGGGGDGILGFVAVRVRYM